MTETMFGIKNVIGAAESLFGGSPAPAPASPAPDTSPQNTDPGLNNPPPPFVPAIPGAAPPAGGSTPGGPPPTFVPAIPGMPAPAASGLPGVVLPQGGSPKPPATPPGTVNPVDINADAAGVPPTIGGIPVPPVVKQSEKPQSPSPKPGEQPKPGSDPKPAPKPGEPGWEGSAAQKEAEAAEQLKKKVEALKALDKQLDELGAQIVDDNAEAKKKLKALQDDIDKELKYQETSPDSSVVKAAALNKFLQDKADEAAKVVTDAAAVVAQRQGQITGLGNQYPGDVTGAGVAPGPYGSGYGGDPSAMGYGGGYEDPYAAGYEDPYYTDEGGSGWEDAASGVADALPQMASAIPGALGGLGGGANPVGDLGGIIGSALQGAAQRRDEEPRDEKPEPEDPENKPGEPTPPTPENENNTDDNKGDQNQDQDEKDDEGKEGEPEAKPDGPAPASPPAPTLVVRPDGTNATAGSPAAAAAARAHLGGAALEDSYKAAGIDLPAPSTPIKDTLPALSAAQIGDLAVFKDRYVMLMGDNKVYLDGEMQPASALAKLTGFVAFRKAPEPTTPYVPAAAPGAAAATPAV